MGPISQLGAEMCTVRRDAKRLKDIDAAKGRADMIFTTMIGKAPELPVGTEGLWRKDPRS